jgi:hypothetical protein
MKEAVAAFTQTGQRARIFTEFQYETLDSWGRPRRVIGKAERTEGKANPRFVVTSLSAESCRLNNFTKISTVRVGTWRIGSRNNSPCLPIASAPKPCKPTNLGH